MSEALSIPFDDQSEFAALEDRARADVLRWLGIVDRVENFNGSRTKAFVAVGDEFGCSPKTVEARFYRFVKAGRCWRALINRAKFKKPEHGGGLPPLFVDWWKGLVEEHQRNGTVKTAHGALRRRLDAWEAGDESKAIPGFPRPPKRRRGSMPRGMSYKNLNSPRYLPTAIEKAARRQGSRSVALFLPSNISTRVGLRPGEIVYIDDRWYDLKVYSDRNRKPQRPVGFLACDHLTACHPDYCWGVQEWDVEEEKRRTLTRVELTWFVLKMLSFSVGYRRDGSTQYVGEKGAAFLPKPIQDGIIRATGGKFKFRTSGGFGDPVFTELLFHGQHGGNPRFKAPVESCFNLGHNEFSPLLGQVGKDPNHCPEEVVGMDSYAVTIWKLCQSLPPEIASLLISPYLTTTEFGRAAMEIHERINRRPEHTLEGWAESGFVRKMIRASRASENWLSCDEVARLPAPEREKFALAAGDPDCVSPERMTPREAWETRRSSDFAYLDLAAWPVVLPHDPAAGFAYATKVSKKGTIRVGNKRGGEALEYWADIPTAAGDKTTLREGRELLVFANPLAPEFAPCTDLRGRAVGVLELRPRPCASDIDGRLREQGRINATKSALLRNARLRSEGLAATRAAEIEHNRALMQLGSRHDPKAKKPAKRRALERKAEELLEQLEGEE